MKYKEYEYAVFPEKSEGEVTWGVWISGKDHNSIVQGYESLGEAQDFALNRIDTLSALNAVKADFNTGESNG